MSKLTLDYPHLENAQRLYYSIVDRYENFDRGWPDADRARNFKALQEVINRDENMYRLSIRLRTVETEDGEMVRSIYTYDDRLSTYVDLNPVEWIEQMFDFESPLDVLALLDDFEQRSQEFKSLYIIKTA